MHATFFSKQDAEDPWMFQVKSHGVYLMKADNWPMSDIVTSQYGVSSQTMGPLLLRGYVKVGLVLPGVSYWLCLCVYDWNAKQQFHHLFATLQLGSRQCLVGF